MTEDHPVPGRLAAEVVFCLERLRALQKEQPRHAWLWRLRAKIVLFVVDYYGLRDLARNHTLSGEEKARLLRTSRLLRPHARGGPVSPSDEIRKVRDGLREKLGRTVTWGGSARPGR